MKIQFKYPMALGALLFCLGSSPAFAQDKGGPVPLPPSPLQGLDSEQSSLQEEMKELFRQVERNLVRIDKQLANAGAGDAILEGMQDAGLDDLLRSVQSKGTETRSQIDRILQIAKEMDQKGGGSGGGGKKPSQEPKPGDSKGGPQQEENTPEAKQPGEEEEGEKPKPGDEPKGGGEDQEQGGENLPGNQPKDGAKGRVQNNVDADRWGFLPERQRKTFRNQGRDNLPSQYRQWIDTYYRRLNKDSK